MKKFKLNIVLLLMFAFSSISTFAQNPGDFDDVDDPNPTDAPIGDYIWVIALLGILLASYKIFNKRLQKS